MNSYVNFITKFRKPLFALLMIINLTALIGLFRITISSDFEIFVPNDSKHRDILDEYSEYFPNNKQVLIMIEIDDKTITSIDFQELRSIQNYLENYNTITNVKGPTPETITLNNKEINLDNLTEEEAVMLNSYYQKLESLSPVIQKDDKTYAMFTSFIGDDFSAKDLKSIETFLRDNDFNFYLSGDQYTQLKIIDFILKIILIIPPVAIFLILNVFKSQMRSFKATILSVLPAALGALWTLGLIGWIGLEVSLITVLAPIFTIVIGSADGLHFVSHVQDNLRDDKNHHDSIVETLKVVGIPMIITTITSIAGFLSLLVMNTNAINDLAVFASTGILLAGIITWYVLPLILVGEVDIDSDKQHRNLLAPYIKKLWGKPSYIITGIVLVISILSFSSVKTEFNFLMIYKDYTEVQQNNEKIMDINNGTMPLFLFVELDDDPLTKDNAEELNLFLDELKSENLIGKSMNIYDYFMVINKEITHSDELTFPENPIIIEQIYNSLKADVNNPADEMINRDAKMLKTIVFPTDLDNETLENIDKKINDFNQENDNIELNISGTQYIMKDLNEEMIGNQVSSISIAFILILVSMLITLRKVKPAIISLVPIMITVITLYGFLGLSGISLNIVTTTIFSITIGVGIDYAIHYTSVWLNYKQKGLSSAEAVEQAYNFTSRPIIANALGIALGLTALVLSPLKIHSYVTTLIWVTMVISVFLSLSLLPTILRKIK